ncbi:hypothetical protein [Romboutsia sp. 1001285H_161024_C4]|uniref:hypothetical protein n=1 Tax=Romboutsia sp. 1001285H_161024_C4 TaxID=2787109 RepID=UPI0018972668|nr:hypothetical protein [Romboutsia sp. 1001285H_161024_C4]
MNKDFYVYDGVNEYNQIEWVKEKIENILNDILIELKYGSNEYKNKSNYNGEGLREAFFDTLKLYAFFNQIKLNDDIYRFIYDYNLDGLDHVKYILGISNKKDIFTVKIECRKEVLGFISEYNHRTELHNIIQRYKSKYPNFINQDKWFNTIYDDLEDVSNGEKAWSWFYNKHKNDHKDNKLFNIPTLESVISIEKTRD